MSGEASRAYQPVIRYFTQLESKVLYRLLLGGTKHFGFYPRPGDQLSQYAAQELMHLLLANTLRLRSSDHVLDAGR